LTYHSVADRTDTDGLDRVAGAERGAAVDPMLIARSQDVPPAMEV